MQIVLPFECPECDQHQIDEFSVFLPMDHWMILIPEKRLIHVHFVGIALDDTTVVEVAKFIRQQVDSWLEQYPKQEFFVMLDLSKMDNSVGLPNCVREIYETTLNHPEVAEVVIYRATTAMQSIIRLFEEDSRTPIHLVKTWEEANRYYNQWWDSTSIQ